MGLAEVELVMDYVGEIGSLESKCKRWVRGRNAKFATG